MFHFSWCYKRNLLFCSNRCTITTTSLISICVILWNTAEVFWVPHIPGLTDVHTSNNSVPPTLVVSPNVPLHNAASMNSSDVVHKQLKALRLLHLVHGLAMCPVLSGNVDNSTRTSASNKIASEYASSFKSDFSALMSPFFNKSRQQRHKFIEPDIGINLSFSLPSLTTCWKVSVIVRVNLYQRTKTQVSVSHPLAKILALKILGLIKKYLIICFLLLIKKAAFTTVICRKLRAALLQSLPPTVNNTSATVCNACRRDPIAWYSDHTMNHRHRKLSAERLFQSGGP